MKKKFLFVFVIFNIFYYASTSAQVLANIHYEDGSEDRAFIQQAILQNDDYILVRKKPKGKKIKIPSKKIKSIAIFPKDDRYDSTYYAKIPVYINHEKTVIRWVSKLYLSNHIGVFMGTFAKGTNRKGWSIFYNRGDNATPYDYLYIIRTGEPSATIWAYFDHGGLSAVSSKVAKKRFIERSIQYFNDAPILKDRLLNNEFSKEDWYKIVRAYEKEKFDNKDNESKNTNINRIL